MLCLSGIACPRSIGICVSTLSNEGQPYCLIPLSFCLPSLCFHPIRQRACWGAISLHWDVKAPIKDDRIFLGPSRSELEKRLLADTCQYCGTTGDAEPIEVHHIRALK